MDLAQFEGPWWLIIQRFRNGDDIERQEILDALASDYPVVDEAKLILHTVIEGNYSFKRGNKSRRVRLKSILPSLVNHVEARIKGDDLEGLSPQTLETIKELIKESDLHGETPRTIAKQEVARQFSISVRLLEKIMTDVKRSG